MIFKSKARQLFYKIKLGYCHFILIFFIILFTSSCNFKIRYPYEYPSKTQISFEENFWFWGLIGEQNYEIYNICKGARIYEIRISSSILQSTITILSLGIFSPRTTTIVCSIRGEENI